MWNPNARQPGFWIGGVLALIVVALCFAWISHEKMLDDRRHELHTEASEAYTQILKVVAYEGFAGERASAQHGLDRALDNLAAFDLMYPRVRARCQKWYLEAEDRRGEALPF